MITKNILARLSPYRFITGLLIALLVAGFIGAIFIFSDGLVITNLSDQTPWGLWIVIDLSAIALSAGAFAFCAATYLLGLKQLLRLARIAAFVGLIGYSVAMLCLLLDIGRPDRFYFGFIFWNTHSVLWEVTMCVGLYFMVLTVENMPTLARWNWLVEKAPRLTRWMSSTHDYAPYLAVAGLILSVLHQSSLGATYGVLAARPIWFRPGLAGLFFVSALAGGIAMTMIVAIVAGLNKPKQQITEDEANPVAVFLGWLLLAYFYLRFWDLVAMSYTDFPGRAEGLSLLTQGSLALNFWVLEVFLGILVPMVLLLKRKYRAKKSFLLAALLLVVLGLVVFRWDTTMVGQMVALDPLYGASDSIAASYTPSLVELVTSIGIVAYAILLISFGVRKLGLLSSSY